MTFSGQRVTGALDLRWAKVLLLVCMGMVMALDVSPADAQQPVSGSTAGKEREALPDPNLSRLFFGPTGRTLPGGEGYAGLFELFFPFVSYGATDWLTLSAGSPILPGFMGEIFYLAPKARVVDAPGLQVSTGVLAVFATDVLDEGSVGIVYGAGTAGDDDRAVTLGAGWGFAGAELANKPVLMLGLEHRTGIRSKLISENYIVPGVTGAILSGGVRLFGENFSGDVGIGAAVGEEGGCCLPLLNFVYHFGGPGR